MVISFVDIPVINFHAWCGVKINICSYSLEYEKSQEVGFHSRS
jgi:hypothetical protein